MYVYIHDCTGIFVTGCGSVVQWVSTLIGQVNNKTIPDAKGGMGALVYGLGADEPTCTPLGHT